VWNHRTTSAQTAEFSAQRREIARSSAQLLAVLKNLKLGLTGRFRASGAGGMGWISPVFPEWSARRAKKLTRLGSTKYQTRMKRSRRPRKQSPAPAAADVAADQAGPTAEFQTRYAIVRHGVGKRVMSRVEAMLERGELAPESAYAGLRYGQDFALSVGRSAAAGWRFDSPRAPKGSALDPCQQAFDAAGRLREAENHLDREAPAPAPGHRPSELVRLVTIDDLPWTEAAMRLGVVDERKVKRAAVRCLDVLAEWYAKADEIHGKSDTPRTIADALQRFVPPMQEAA
jgi:hypothetical protein